MRLNVLVAYLAIAALCWQFELTNSRTSTLWRLNPNIGKITSENLDNVPDVGNTAAKGNKNANFPAIEEYDPTVDIYTKDHVFRIIATTLNEGGGGGYSAGWIRQSPEMYPRNDVRELQRPNNKTIVNISKKEKSTQRSRVGASSLIENEKLNCGQPVNYTRFDNLLGIEQRHFYHPPVPEPEVANLFLNTNDEYAYRNFDIAALERRLKHAKHEQGKDMSFELYTEIGNYFRIIGDSRQAIECFRHAVAKRSHPEALRNLARVLYNLEYFSDAMRVSLESINLAPDGYVPWQEFFILGEIFRASGRAQESSLHLRHALELYPHHEPILKVLRDVENSVLSSLHIYTLFIIIVLVVAVFIVIISSSVVGIDNCNTSTGNVLNSNFCSTQFDGESRPQRHFNRAMAMRSLKRHRRF